MKKLTGLPLLFFCLLFSSILLAANDYKVNTPLPDQNSQLQQNQNSSTIVTWPIKLTIKPPLEKQFNMPNKKLPRDFQCYFTYGTGYPVDSSQLVAVSTIKEQTYEFKKEGPADQNSNLLICITNMKKSMRSGYHVQFTCRDTQPGATVDMVKELEKNGKCMEHRAKS